LASTLEIKLGYTFTEPALLIQATTHRSFGAHHNERLEFLGDSVLNCAIAKLIFDSYPAMPEGELSRLRANLVNQSVLAEIAAELGVGPLLRLGEGELKTGGASRPSILADAVEALLGAAFVDAGFDCACAIVKRLFAVRLRTVDGKTAPDKDGKTALQEWLQARHLPLPQYAVTRIDGEAHQQIFEVHCNIVSESIATSGSGHSRRAAEQDAASKAYVALLQRKAGTSLTSPAKQNKVKSRG